MRWLPAHEFSVKEYLDTWDAVTAMPDACREWKVQRKRALVRESACRYCGGTERLVVHHICGPPDKHKSYTLFGLNTLMNLAVLCRHCHWGVERAAHTHVWRLLALSPGPDGSDE